MLNQKIKVMSRLIADACVRNTFLEDLHSGISPSSAVGDYSDVKVVSPYGEIPWLRTSRISDKQMRELMLEIEKKINHALILLLARYSPRSVMQLGGQACGR